MTVDPKDGRCRECGGALEITDADDVTLEVTCLECGETYLVEHDAFNDGGMHYYPCFLVKPRREDREADPQGDDA